MNAVAMIAEAEKMAIHLSVKDVLESQTIKLLAQRVQVLDKHKVKVTDEDLDTIAINLDRVQPYYEGMEIEDAYSLSYGQRYMIQQYANGQHDARFYHFQESIKLSNKALNIDLLARAFESVVRNHAMLRTHFLINEKIAAQVVLKKVAPPFYFHYPCQEAYEDKTLLIHEIMQKSRERQPFDTT